jgi:hypothetical protein
VAESDNSRSLFLLDVISRGVTDGSAIVLATDLHANEITKLLTSGGLNVKQLTDDGILTILYMDSVYSVAETGLEAERLLNRWLSFVSDVKKTSGCNSILAIGTGKVFFESNNLEKLVEYERRIGKTVGGLPIDAICYFDADSFCKLSLADTIQFLNYHEYTIYQGGIYVQWHPLMVLEIINKAIDRVLGPGASAISLKTLKLIYGLGDDTILSQPALFEEKLQKMFGKSDNIILKRIQKEMTMQLLYLHRAKSL